jgi:hypothetical protein
MNRLHLTNSSIEKTIEEHQRKIGEIGKPFLAPIQFILDEVNGRAYARAITEAQWIFDVAIELEIELRTKGVTIKNMKSTTIHFCGSAGFKGVSTGVHLKRGASGWFVTHIEKSYEARSKRLVSIIPKARADVIKAQLGRYREVKEKS